MRIHLLVAAAVAVSVAVSGSAIAASDDTAADALAQRAEACIQAAVPAVAAEPGSLSDGVDFLVNDLCSVDVRHFDAYRQNARQLAEWRKASQTPPFGLSMGNPSIEAVKSVEAEQQSEVAKASLDPNTGELIVPPDFSPPINPTAMMSLTINADGDPNARFKVFAARALLAARTPASR
jgi:hypothetical protein